MQHVVRFRLSSTVRTSVRAKHFRQRHLLVVSSRRACPAGGCEVPQSHRTAQGRSCNLAGDDGQPGNFGGPGEFTCKV